MTSIFCKKIETREEKIEKFEKSFDSCFENLEEIGGKIVGKAN